MSFNEDRSLITEASVFRKPLTGSLDVSKQDVHHSGQGKKKGQPRVT
jgi:hypothetical protein